MDLLPRLSSLFDLRFLPQELSFIGTGTAQALQGVFYKNYNANWGGGIGTVSFDIDLVSYKVLRLDLPGTGFALSINEQDLVVVPGQAIIPVTNIPVSGSYRWGILKYVPAYDISQAPISTALDFIAIADQILGSSPEAQFSALFEAFVAQPIAATAVNTTRLPQLQIFATTLRTRYGSALNLANPLIATTELAAAQEILAALTAANIGMMQVVQDLYIFPPSSSAGDSLAAFDKYFYAATSIDFRAFVLDLLVPEVFVATELAAAVEFPRSVMLPVRYDVTKQKYLVVADPNTKTKLVFAKAQFTFSTKGGFGYAANLAVSLPPDQQRVQLGDTGLQLEFTEAKLDLSTQKNIPEADADGRPSDFRGIYVARANVFLPDSWSVTAGSIGVTKLLVGTGGISGTFAVQGTGLLQAHLFRDVRVNFQSFDITFSHSEVVSSNIRGTFTLETFLGPNGLPAPFAFELTYAADGYQLAFAAPVVSGKPVPVTVQLGSLADVHFTKLAIGKKGSDWYLDVAADIEVTQALPIIGKALPSKIIISQLLIHSDPARVAITARPTWDDGTQLTVNPRDGFSLSKTLNLTILNVLKVEQLRLSTHKDPDGTLQTLATFDATLGLTSDSTAAAPAGGTIPPPGFHAHIANAGFTAALKPTPDGTGNLALANVQLGVKLPDSVGVSVNAGGLVGAGNLAILDHGNRYEGVLALAFRDKINLAAYGILTKNLPGGGDGPSLLALITAQFQAIQLGLGFTLNAVGGLLGLNRAADTDNLRGLVRAGQLNKLLFPSPATASLAELTATLAVIDAAFPATPGRYLIGLMARLGWGAQKTLITLDVALLVELPSPVRLMILGVIKTSLPSEENDLLKLRADFLGTVDFGSKRAAFDATLSDSHLLASALTGDLAFRFYQGNNPLFVLTAGGFHPAFQPPAGAGLTRLNRLTLALSRGNDLRVTLTSYFAVTSNTVQFGSHLELYYRIARGLHVEGYFGFDVLFQFSPFHVQAHLEAGVAINYGSRELLSLHLALDITGPGPWHIWGSASFKVWFVRIHVEVDATIGGGSTEPAWPATDVQALLVTALDAAASWEVEAPKTALPGGVVLRPVGPTAAPFFLDPRGALVLRQRVMPLGVPLGHYGRGPIAPTTGRQFDLTALVVAGVRHAVATDKAVETVRDFFAPDQFQPLTDAEKLSLPSFQLLPCGLRLARMAGLVADEKATLRVVEYEHKLIGGVSGGTTTSRPPKMSTRGYQHLVRGGALGQEVAAAQPSARATRRKSLFEPGRVKPLYPLPCRGLPTSCSPACPNADAPPTPFWLQPRQRALATAPWCPKRLRPAPAAAGRAPTTAEPGRGPQLRVRRPGLVDGRAVRAVWILDSQLKYLL